MSIWHTNIEIPEESNEQIIFFAGGSRFPYVGWYNSTYDIIDDWSFKRDVQKWAYTRDLLKVDEILSSLLKILDKKEGIDNVYEIKHKSSSIV